jgi:hypothetical protein
LHGTDYCICFMFQAPRPLTQSDLEKVLATSIKTKVAASEYTGLTSQSAGWSRNREPADYQVQAAISELSKLVVSQILNIQSDAPDQ